MTEQTSRIATVSDIGIKQTATGYELHFTLCDVPDYADVVAWLARLGQMTGDFPPDQEDMAPPEPGSVADNQQAVAELAKPPVEVVEPEKKTRRPRNTSRAVEAVVPQNAEAPLIAPPTEAHATTAAVADSPKPVEPEPLTAPPAAQPIDGDEPLVAALQGAEIKLVNRAIRALVPLLPPDVVALPLEKRVGWIVAFARRVGGRVPAFATKLARHDAAVAFDELAATVQNQATVICAQTAME